MNPARLDTVEIEPRGPADAAIIWLHGLGANARDFEPIVPYLRLPADLGLRFVFPNAPRQPVTVNGGMVMPAWYDILGIDIPRREDEAGVRASETAIRTLIEREVKRGVEPGRIILAGFSQGAAIALQTGLRHPKRLGGILALSGYLPLIETVEAERAEANRDIPIFLAHGAQDVVIGIDHARRSRERLESLGYAPRWKEYPMGHEVCLEEIQEIGAWIREVLG